MEPQNTPAEATPEVPTVTVEQTHVVELPEENVVLQTPAGVPDERIVYDRDEAGNVIGWHKEVVNG